MTLGIFHSAPTTTLYSIDTYGRSSYIYKSTTMKIIMCNFATWLYTKLNGEYVGSDDFGNRYYQSKKESRQFGRKNRWVIYKGLDEPSKVPPEWFVWLHYQTDEVLSNNKKYSWEKLHQPNLTGTKFAYYPKGHALSNMKRDKATGDYESWHPNNQV
jgi:NADH:ubiquinone oxidoreductase subunit